MPKYLKRCWATVDLDNLEFNLEAVRQTVPPDCLLMGVIKADAYGHGDKYVAAHLAGMGVDCFGVSNFEEALSLREKEIFQPVLIFGITPPEYAPVLAKYSLTQTVHSLDYAKRLNAEAEKSGVSIQVHIKIDTGVSRLGFVFTGDEFERGVAEIIESCALPRLRTEGIYSHFAVADDSKQESIDYTKSQIDIYNKVIGLLSEKGITFRIRHLCASAGIISYPEAYFDLVRPGVILYGICPSRDCQMDIKPIMSIYSCVSMVKEIEAGCSVGYGRTFTAERKMKIATVPVGYADGYPRKLSGQGRMLIRGQFANIVGRVCMDQLMLDVTHIDGVCEDDIVTVVGTDGANSVTFDELASLTGTIPHEIMSFISKRVPRVYLRDGKEVAITNHLTRWFPSQP